MKLIKTEDAVGHVLCHDLTQIIKDQYKDARFRKGHVVTQEDIPVLLSMGKEHLYVWEMTPGMLHENDAAERLLALGACDFHDCHAYTVPLLFARGDAGKLRLFLRGALIQRLGLHRQIRSWLHRLTSRLVFPESRGICEKFF